MACHVPTNAPHKNEVALHFLWDVISCNRKEVSKPSKRLIFCEISVKSEPKHAPLVILAQ
ncbi:hypothetical protein B1R32_104174 [Abditibacterium utsteinense]|uniref:Uncharacterized protein n=1 Tax=Abditibacterium utsteinense TaxID=1960156 RepID=A0A2S8SV61_9BACT|nr:hypothetical protein B1R32_104174 [Abditibacterium utsteinense]